MLQIWPLVVALLCCHSMVVSSAQYEHITAEIVTVGYSLPQSIASLAVQGPAFDLAVEEVRQLYTEITFIQTHINIFESCWTAADSLEYRLSSWFYGKPFTPNVTVILSPGMCGSEPARRLNQWAGNHNILLLTTVAYDVLVRDREFSPTYISLTLSSINMPSFYEQLLHRYNWTTVFVLSEAKSISAYPGQADLFSSYAKAAGAQLTVRTYDAPNNGSEFEDVLKEFSRLSRVMFFFGHARLFRQLVIKALQLNMTDGNYVYLPLDYLPLPELYGYYSPLYNGIFDDVARQAFRSVLVTKQYSAMPLTSSHLQSHLPDFRRRSLEDYNATVPKEFAGYFCLMASYASVLLFAHVIEEVRLVGNYDELDNGSALARRFLDRDFDTKIGQFDIDKFGQSLINITVEFTDFTTSERKVFLELDSGGGSLLREVSPMPWLLGHPPLNKPLCGYTGDECTESSFHQDRLFGSMAVMLLLLVTAMWFLRHGKRSLDRKSVKWCLLNHEDLQVIEHPKSMLDGFSNAPLPSNICWHTCAK